jgi:hypothetical protein
MKATNTMAYFLSRWSFNVLRFDVLVLLKTSRVGFWGYRVKA